MRRSITLLAWVACTANDPPAITSVWTDGFERTTLHDNYRATGGGYELRNGAVAARGAHNHPLWLRKKLPRDVRVEFDCGSNDSRGDIKIELFGDGRSFDADGGRYTASGYELIFGGWGNSKSIIARLDEHGRDVAQRVVPKVIPGQRYHWKIERRGHVVTWWIESVAPSSGGGEAQTPFLAYDDMQPLEGLGHEYFAFNNWETDTWFDNLVVTPL